jgi:hypothetical protein
MVFCIVFFALLYVSIFYSNVTNIWYLRNVQALFLYIFSLHNCDERWGDGDKSQYSYNQVLMIYSSCFFDNYKYIVLFVYNCNMKFNLTLIFSHFTVFLYLYLSFDYLITHLMG